MCPSNGVGASVASVLSRRVLPFSYSRRREACWSPSHVLPSLLCPVCCLEAFLSCSKCLMLSPMGFLFPLPPSFPWFRLLVFKNFECLFVYFFYVSYCLACTLSQFLKNWNVIDLRCCADFCCVAK